MSAGFWLISSIFSDVEKQEVLVEGTSDFLLLIPSPWDVGLALSVPCLIPHQSKEERQL